MNDYELEKKTQDSILKDGLEAPFILTHTKISLMIIRELAANKVSDKNLTIIYDIVEYEPKNEIISRSEMIFHMIDQITLCFEDEEDLVLMFNLLWDTMKLRYVSDNQFEIFDEGRQ